MTQQKLGFYTDIQAHAPAAISAADQLIIEIGFGQVVLMVKSQLPKQIEGFEIFSIESLDTDWNDVLDSINKISKLLTRKYNDVLVCYNLPEALAIPSSQFTNEAGKDFLSQIYGDTYQTSFLHDTVFAAQIEIAHRTAKEIGDWMNREFPNHKTAHVYSLLLNGIFAKSLPEGNALSIQFYSKHLVVALLKDKKLQIIQSFTYDVEEDILYYIMSLVQQFGLDAAQTRAEISGELDRQSGIAKKLPSLIGNINWEEAGNSGIFNSISSQYPAHYFTHYYKLGA